MELEVSNEFIENIKKTGGDFFFVSHYNSNNIIVQIERQKDNFQFLIFSYEIYQEDSNLKYIKSFNQNSVIFSKKERIEVWFIIPGRKYNEIILFSKELDVWTSVISSSNHLTSFQLLKKNFDLSDFEYSKDEFFFDIIPRDVFPYFINDEFIGIAIFIENDCYLIINLYDNQTDSFQFISEKEFFLEDNKDLYICLFSIQSGTILIKSNAQRKFNNEYPFIIKVIDQFNLPLDIIILDDSLYIIESFQIVQYQINNNFQNNIHKFKNKIVNAGFLSSIPALFTLSEKEKYYSLDVNTIEFSKKSEFIKLTKSFDLDLDSDTLNVIKLMNNSLGLIFDKKSIIFWSFSPGIKTHFENFIIKVQKLEKYNPLECLKFLEENYFEIKNESKRTIIQRKSYTREEDLFILDHIYNDLTLKEISAKVEHPSSSIYARFSANYGTPSCDDHYLFTDSCMKCKETLSIWKKDIKQKILEKDYNIRSYADPELCRLYTKKERIIRSQTIHLRSRISAEIYDSVVKFLAQINCVGKSFNKLFLQSLRLFIGKKIAEIRLKDINPSSSLALFCEITPDLKTLRDLKKEYFNIVNEKPVVFSNKNILLLKGINALGKLFDDNNFILIKRLLIKILKLTKNPKAGLLPAIIYLLRDKDLTQQKICDAFKVTPVSLRKEIKEIKANSKLLNLLYDCKLRLKKFKKKNNFQSDLNFFIHQASNDKSD